MAVQIQNWAMFGFAIILSSLIALYFYVTRNFNYWKKKGVAVESAVPFFGSFLPCVTFQKSANDFFEDIHAKHNGESVVGFYLFDKPSLLVRDIDLINRIMVKDFNLFANRYGAPGDHDVLGSANLFFLRTPHWKIVRSKLTATFTSGKLRSMFNLIVDVGKDLESHFDSFILEEGNGQVMELKETCAKYTTDVIATCAYGLKANSLNDPDAEFRKNGRMIFHFNYKRGFEIAAIFFAPAIVKPLGIMFFTKPCGTFLREALWGTLTHRMKSGVRRNDLIDTLIELKKGQTQAEIDDPNSFKFDGDNLTAQAAIYFTAGFSTTSITMAYTLYELALNLDIQSRLREEITMGFKKNEELSYDWIMQLPYLEMVVSETLRKYSVLGFIDRVAAVDYQVPDSDLVIEKGTPIFISIAGFHHDPEYFPDPGKYDPERFNGENKQTRPSRVYMPFGEGPRNCIGLRFALASAKLGLVKMIMNYKFTTCEDTVIPTRPNPRSFFTEMDHGLFLNVEKVATVTG